MNDSPSIRSGIGLREMSGQAAGRDREQDGDERVRRRQVDDRDRDAAEGRARRSPPVWLTLL